MDLNIENVGLVEGWSPPVGDVLSPGFRATIESLAYANAFEDCSDTSKARIFIDKLEDEGYCIAKYKPD